MTIIVKVILVALRIMPIKAEMPRKPGDLGFLLHESAMPEQRKVMLARKASEWGKAQPQRGSL